MYGFNKHLLCNVCILLFESSFVVNKTFNYFPGLWVQSSSCHLGKVFDPRCCIIDQQTNVLVSNETNKDVRMYT